MFQKYDNNYNKKNLLSVKKLTIKNHSFISRLTVSQDEELHSHEFFEIVLIRYGSITHSVKGEKYVMNIGDACMIAPGIQHSFIRNGECAHRDVLISGSLFKKTCDFLNIDLYGKLLDEGIFKFSISIDQIKNFEKEYSSFIEIDDENAIKIRMKTICCQLLCLSYTNPQSVADIDTFKSNCITVINEAYNKKNVVDILLNEFGYTQGHFCKKFKKSFNVTLIEYINRRRIISAASTLVLTNDSIEECCRSVGFESLPHFIKLFKQHYGTTPAKYRRDYKLNS